MHRYFKWLVLDYKFQSFSTSNTLEYQASHLPAFFLVLLNPFNPGDVCVAMVADASVFTFFEPLERKN